MQLIKPGWAAPGGLLARRVQAFTTSRAGGVSEGPYASMNLGDHVGDAPAAVTENREQLVHDAKLPAPPLWLNQVHGNHVIHDSQWLPGIEADAIISKRADVALAVLTADCLPVLLASTEGDEIGAIHAGWRGLAGNIIQNTVAAMSTPASALVVWIGPGISQVHYEVDDAVREAFITEDHLATNCFAPNERGRWQADLKSLAVIALRSVGVRRITDAGLCSFALDDRFFSHRRSAPTGRMASLIRLLPG
ncbi:MAG: peptidoglycan editing factor PgeF [Pseudomonadota bacterium]